MNAIKNIESLFGQPGIIDVEIKSKVEDLTGEPLILYSFIDLDGDFKFTESWICLTKSFMAISEKNGALNLIKLDNLLEIKELSAPSSNSYDLVGVKESGILGRFNVSSRQKLNVTNITHYFKEYKNVDNVLDKSSDEYYQEGLLKEIKSTGDALSNKKAKTVLRLLRYLLPYKKECAIGLFSAVCMTVLALVPAYLTGRILDQIITPFQKGELTKEMAFDLVWPMIGIIGFVYLLKEFFIWLRLKTMSIVGELVARDLRKELFGHLQSLGMDFYSKMHTGSIISRVSSDTDRLWDFVAFGIVEVVIALFTLVGLSTVLMFLDLKLGLLMTLPVPILLISIYRHGEKMKLIFLKAHRKWSDLTSVLSDTIPGMMVVKAFNQEESEIRKFEKCNERVTDQFNDIHYEWTKFWPVLMLSMHFLTMLVWFMAIPRLLSPSGEVNNLTAGVYVSFLLYMTMFMGPIEVIGQIARMMNRALSSAYRIFELLDNKPSIVDSESSEPLECLKGNIKFQNVDFSYDGIRQIIKGMNFEIKSGEMIGLVGPSGGGKSTLTKLLTRFYDIDRGKILIDDRDLTSLSVGSFRSQVGMVLQDPFLFHGSILENISYGVENASKSEVIKAAKMANAHEFIMKFPFGYNSIVGERGQTLSGGERQRISIARAIVQDPKVLILDEATSAVDTETEKKIQDALDYLVKGRTVISIAHRLSTLKKANRIFVVEDGKLSEVGTHDELLRNENSKYKKLYSLQAKFNDESFEVNKVKKEGENNESLSN